MMAYHAAYMREGSKEVSKRNTMQFVEALVETLEGVPIHV